MLTALRCLWSCWGFLGYIVARVLPTSRTWDGVALHCVARGRVANWFRARRWAAVTLGWVILWGEPRSPFTRPHERRHVTQSYWLGPLYLPVYFAILPFTGYRNHPLERDARRAAGQE